MAYAIKGHDMSFTSIMAESMRKNVENANGKQKKGWDGFYNTALHVSGQAFMSILFGESSARFISDLHERKLLRGGNEDPLMDVYADLLNNEMGRVLGTKLAEKYDLSGGTEWTNSMMANVLNDIQSYVQDTFGMKFKSYTADDEEVKELVNILNKIMEGNAEENK